MLKIPQKLIQQLQAALEYYNINKKINLSILQREMGNYIDPWLYFNELVKKTGIRFQDQIEEKAFFKLLRRYWRHLPRQDLFGFSQEIKGYLEKYERDLLSSLKDKFGLRWGGLAQPVINQLKVHLVKISLKHLSLWFTHRNSLKFKSDFAAELKHFFFHWLYTRQAELFNMSPLDYFFLENRLKRGAAPLELVNWQAGEVNILMELEGKKILRQKKIMKKIKKDMAWIFRQIEERKGINPAAEREEVEEKSEGKRVEIYEIPLKEKFPIITVAERYGNQALRVSNPFFLDTMVDRDIARFAQSAFVPTVKMGVALSMIWATNQMDTSNKITKKIALESLYLALNYHRVSIDALQGINSKALFIPRITTSLMKMAEEIQIVLEKLIRDLEKEER